MQLARKELRGALSKCVKVPSIRNFSVAEPRKLLTEGKSLINFEKLASHHLNEITEVKDFLEQLQYNRPQNKEDCLKVNHVLSRFFIMKYRKLNPDLDIAISRTLLEIGELCGKIYSELAPLEHFEEDPCFWVWNGLEEEFKATLKYLSVTDCLRIYWIFWPNQKGSREFWDLLTWRFATFKEDVWEAQEVVDVLQSTEHYARLYDE